jgi:hypothetical protein
VWFSHAGLHSLVIVLIKRLIQVLRGLPVIRFILAEASFSTLRRTYSGPPSDVLLRWHQSEKNRTSAFIADMNINAPSEQGAI